MHYPCGDGLANATWNYLKLAHNFFFFFSFFLLVDWIVFFVISTYGNMTIENIRPRLLLIQVCNLGSYSLFLHAGIQLK